MKSSRNARRLAPLVALAMLAAACGNGDSGGNSGDGGGSASTELRISTWSDWTFLQDLADQYMEKNPDVDIQIDAIPGQEYFDNLPRTLGLDEAPDITVLQVTQVGLYRQLVKDGLLADVSDVWDSQKLADVTPQAVVDTYTEKDGSHYAVNSGLTFLPAVYYNKDMFKELGIEVPDGGRLSSYDELDDIVAKLQDAGKLPMTYNWEEAHHMFQQNLQSSCGEEKYIALGGSWKPGSDASVSWTDDCVVNAITAYADLAKAGTFGKDPLMGFDVAMAGFTSGQSGMLTTGMWAVDQIRDEADFDFGWFMMPPIEGGQDDTHWVLWLADGLGVAANSPNKDVAKDFLEFTMTKDAQGNMPRPPSRTDVKPTNVDPVLADMITSLDGLGTTTHFIQTLAPPEFQDVIQSGSEDVLLGKKTPAEMAQDLEDLAESLRNDG